MAFTRFPDPTNNISNLANQPVESAAVLKQKFDQVGEDLKDWNNNTFLPELESTTDGDSGLGNIGMTPIVGLAATNPQQALEEIVAKTPINVLDGSITDAKLSNSVGQIKDIVATHTEEISDIVTFKKGTHLINVNTTFNKLVIVQEGATIQIRSGAVVTFNKGIDAGWYIIFDTEDNFVANPIVSSSVIIKDGIVKSDWFCSKVMNIELIKTIPDQTNNIMKAYRASAGNYVAVGLNYEIENPKGVLEFGSGFYRTDKTIYLSTIISNVYYRVDGFKFRGAGIASSYLVRTDMTTTDAGMYALYTGEVTTFSDFKYTCYNPDGLTDADKFSSACMTLMMLQGDSLQLSNVWVSGAQNPILDTNGIYRNGVGIQFSSCVDTYFDNVFVENCTTGIAIGSSIVSGVNLELFSIREQAIGLGVFLSDFPDNQTTSSIVNISNIQSIASKRGLYVLENSNIGLCNLSNSYFDGFSSEFSLNIGTVFCDMKPGTSLSGTFESIDIKNFLDKYFYIRDNCSLGRDNSAFFVSNAHIEKQTFSNQGVFYFSNVGTFSNVSIKNISINDINGVILFNPQLGKFFMDDVFISSYVGKADDGSTRQLFVGSGNCDLDIRKLSRSTSDSVTLNSFGFWNAGNVYIDIDNLYNATRAVSGSAVFKMPSKVSFI